MLLAPLALFLGLLAVPIILLYVLKLRRQDSIVSSTYLWRQALEDIQANAPWQRLRVNLLLLLQLLALAALILALARPAYSQSHAIAGDVVVIVDQSYGMQAHDVLPSRFLVALNRARHLVSDLAPGNVMSIIGMSNQPSLQIAESSDPGALTAALDRLHVGTAQPNFLDALSLASSLARSGHTTQVVVLTSRDSGISVLPIAVTYPVQIERVGTQLHDLGITNFAATASGGMTRAVARLSNFGSSTQRSNVDLLAGGQVVDVRPVTVRGHASTNLFWTGLSPSAQRFQLRLTLSDNVTTDKQAWAVVPRIPVRTVLLVSAGDFFLQAALVNDPSLHLFTAVPAAYTRSLAHAFDAVIFDGLLPPALPPTSTLLVNPPAGRLASLHFGKLESAGSMSAGSSALLRDVDLSDVHVSTLRSASLPPWMSTVATAGSHLALAAGTVPAPANTGTLARLALIDFDLQHSDWPLRISFPIELHNLLQYLTPGLTIGESTVLTGASVHLAPPPGTRAVRVSGPNGLSVQLTPPFPPFTHTQHPGFYTVQALGGSGGHHQAVFAVNFFPSRPAPALGPAILHLGQAQPHRSLYTSAPVSVDRGFMALALGLLTLEWWVALRGIGHA